MELTPPGCPEPTARSPALRADTRLQTPDEREGRLLALLLLLSYWKGARERKNDLDRKKKVSQEWMISLVHTHAQTYKYI